MKISFYGAAETVTGSCFLLEGADTKILIDCGMFQGSSELSQLNGEDFPFDTTEIPNMLLTHAHIDHSGRIPKLVKDGFKGKIYTTRATKDLCTIMLEDSAHIQEMEAEYDSRKNRRKGLEDVEPLYTIEDAVNAMQYFEPIEYDQTIQLTDTVKFRLNDAGHMLGSSIIEIWFIENGIEEKIVFSGDLGNHDKPLLKDPTYLDETDYVIMESTYGNRNHKEKNEFADTLLEVILDTLSKDGTVVIPSFAVGRTQEILYEIDQYKAKQMLGKYNDVKVILDSPLAIKATEIFKKYFYILDDETKAILKSGDNPLVFDNLVYTLTTEESKAINTNDDPKIIISASGMADAGRVRHHIKHNIYKKNCALIFVGYQAEGSLGRLLLNGEKSIKLFGERFAVNARIEAIDYYSGHADHDGLLKWIGHFKTKPRKVFLVHGEAESIIDLQKNMRNLGYDVDIAKFKASFDLNSIAAKVNDGINIPQKEQTISSLTSMTEEILKTLKDKEKSIKIDETDKIKLFLECISDILDIQQ